MYPLGTGPEFDSEDDGDDREAQAIPPFEVNYQYEDNSVLPEKFHPYPIVVRKYNQGLTRGYEGEECPAKVHIHFFIKIFEMFTKLIYLI